METRRTLQVVLIVFVASSVAQNFPQHEGFQLDFQPQRVGPHSLSQGQRQTLGKRPPSLEQPAFRTVPQQPIQVQPISVPSQGFSSFSQPQTQTRTQIPTKQQQRPAVRHQQLRQQIRPQAPAVEQPPVPSQQFVLQQSQRQQFDQPQGQRQQFDQSQGQRQQFGQPQVPSQQFDQPQGLRQQFVQPQVTGQQFVQPQVPRQQFEQPQEVPRQQLNQQVQNLQPTAQQVNEHFFNQPPLRTDQSGEPLVVRRPAQGVLPTQKQHQQHQQRQQTQFDPELFKQQAENAHYSFSSAVTDTINDQENVREEERDGLNLRGLYSYSDGFVKRTVHYEADENGYRVTKEEVDNIGDGPRVDPNGRADVTANVEGNNLQYSITSADIPGRSTQSKAQNEQQPFTLTFPSS